MTTAPAPMLAQAPILRGATHTARAPIAAPCSTVTPTRVQSVAAFRVPSMLIARGQWSFVKTAAGPMNTPSASEAGS